MIQTRQEEGIRQDNITRQMTKNHEPLIYTFVCHPITLYLIINGVFGT